MNLEKLDTKTATLIVLGCTAVVLAVLVVDVQIAKQLAARAQELDGILRQKQPPIDIDELRRYNSEVARNHGATPGAPVSRNNGSDSVVGNSGVETGTSSADGDIPMEGWDVFPVKRSQTYGGPGSRNLAIPQNGGSVEPE
jgi:hypothetical protein